MLLDLDVTVRIVCSDRADSDTVLAEILETVQTSIEARTDYEVLDVYGEIDK
jgi:hypothetical protein